MNFSLHLDTTMIHKALWVGEEIPWLSGHATKGLPGTSVKQIKRIVKIS